MHDMACSANWRLTYASQAAVLVRHALRRRKASSPPSTTRRYTVEYDVCRNSAASARVMTLAPAVPWFGPSSIGCSCSIRFQGPPIMRRGFSAVRKSSDNRRACSQDGIVCSDYRSMGRKGGASRLGRCAGIPNAMQGSLRGAVRMRKSAVDSASGRHKTPGMRAVTGELGRRSSSQNVNTNKCFGGKMVATKLAGWWQRKIPDPFSQVRDRSFGRGGRI